MKPEYRQVRFRADFPLGGWPVAFGVVSLINCEDETCEIIGDWDGLLKLEPPLGGHPGLRHGAGENPNHH